MAVLNAAFAAIILGCIYYWISSIFKSRLIGLLTVLFYMGSGHFLTLSVINEDIMPSYFFVLVAMMLASVWFGAATAPRIIAVALIVSIGWLFEWRLLFPVVPPMLLTLWVSARGWK
jgi:4-amino-4-deoxy-L-arabinose transferase-like glycosyltransferase